MNLAFAWPWLFAVLPLPMLVVWLLPRAAQTPGQVLRVPFFRALASAVDTHRSAGPRWRAVVGAIAWGLLVLAASRPQWVGEPIALPVEGRDLMLAVDISGSMGLEDMVLGNQVTDRLTAVKAVAGDFVGRREGDRVGLILFGRQAYLQTPLTFDRQTVNTLLQESAVGLAGQETAIGDAIGLAVKRLRGEPAENRILILLTDGANTAGSVEPLKAADLAAAEGIRIYTIGVGSDRQGPFRGLSVPGGELDEATLKAIASKTGGRYFRARDIRGLNDIYHLLDKLEPVSAEDKTFRPVRELYNWPLSVALALTLLLALAAAGIYRPVAIKGLGHG